MKMVIGQLEGILQELKEVAKELREVGKPPGCHRIPARVTVAAGPK